MNALRKQMEADMALRGLAYRTREAYLGGVAKPARFYGRRPDRISEAEVQRYLLHLLQERRLAHSSCNVVCSALEFFYRVTLKRRETAFCLPRPKVPQRLPQILSREEVAALFENTANLKHRAFLMTTYGGGLRLLEACRLKVADINSDRMTIRVEQGKGYAHGNRRKVMTLAAAARTALDAAPAPQPPEPESVAAFWLRVAALDIQQCPHCKAGRMIVTGPISAPRARAPPP